MLKIYLLGQSRFHFTKDADNPPRKSLANLILAYLIRSREPVSRKRLSKLFWPHLSDKDSRTYLRNIIPRLKERYDPWLIDDQKTLTFKIDDSVWVDLIELESTIESFNATPLPQRNEADSKKLTEALTLYTGPFLENHSEIKQPIFAEWLDSERRFIRSQVVQAYTGLTQYFLSNNNFLAAIDSSKKGIAVDPSYPDYWPLLMKAQIKVGDIKEARSTYNQYIDLGNDQNCEAFSKMDSLDNLLNRSVGHIKF